MNHTDCEIICAAAAVLTLGFGLLKTIVDFREEIKTRLTALETQMKTVTKKLHL